eukprot:2578094-Amphidinium_carterae.1
MNVAPLGLNNTGIHPIEEKTRCTAILQPTEITFCKLFQSGRRALAEVFPRSECVALDRVVSFGVLLVCYGDVMDEAGCCDKELCSHIVAGLDLVVTTAKSGEFASILKPSSLSPDDLLAMCRSVRGKVLSRTSSQGSH